MTVMANYNILLTTAGWQQLVELMEHECEVLKHVIVTKRDVETGMKLSEGILDIMRIRLEIFTELISKPQTIIAQLEKKNSITMPEYDPFFMNLKDVGKNEDYFGTRNPHTLS